MVTYLGSAASKIPRGMGLNSGNTRAALNDTLKNRTPVARSNSPEGVRHLGAIETPFKGAGTAYNTSVSMGLKWAFLLPPECSSPLWCRIGL